MSRYGPDLKTESKADEIAWSHTEKDIVTVTEDGILCTRKNIFESATIVATSTRKHEQALFEYSSDDKMIASVSPEMAMLWDASTLSVLWEQAGNWSYSVAFYPVGHEVVFCFRHLIHVVRVDSPGNYGVGVNGLDFEVDRLVFGPSRSKCATWTLHDAKLLDGHTLEESTSLPYHGVRAMQFTPDGKFVLLVLQSKKIVLWDIAASAVVRELTVDPPIPGLESVRISTDCRVIHLYDYDAETTHVIHLMY
jgi:WD40 repeat protein